LLLYYITDRTQFPGVEPARHRKLLDKIAEAARAGVDFIQLREKDLPTRDLESLAVGAAQILAQRRTANRERRTALLINARTDVAIATGADGVHLRSNDISPATVRSIWSRGAGAPAAVAVSCHSAAEVSAAEGADFAVFAPVFEKRNAQAAGLEALHQACQHRIPVLALGGVTLENARACLDAGAAGIAAIRLFQENDLSVLIPKLRALAP
jgi:thiamine-phosphate pyrophosphorylase